MRRSLKSNLKLLCRVDLHVCGSLYIAAAHPSDVDAATTSAAVAGLGQDSSERGALSTDATFSWWTSVVQHAAAEHSAKQAQWEQKRAQQLKNSANASSAPASAAAPPPPSVDPFAAAVSAAAVGGDAARSGSGIVEGVAFALGMPLPSSARLHRHFCDGLRVLFGAATGAAAAASLEIVGSEAHVLGAFGSSANTKAGQPPPQPAAARALSVFVTLQRRFLPMLRAVCAATVAVDGTPVRLSVGVRPVESRRPSSGAPADEGTRKQQQQERRQLNKAMGSKNQPRPSARRARIRRKAVRRLQSRRVAGGKRVALR